MKIRRLFRRAMLLVLALIIVGGGIIALAPTTLSSLLPASAREAPIARIAHEGVWRVQFLLAKATGGVPALSWKEVIQGIWPGRQLPGTWPGSGFITDRMVTEGRGLDAAVVNPLDDAGSVARGKALFQDNCAPCHGNDGKGSGHAPSLARAGYSIGSSDLAIYKVLRDGIPGTAMAALDLSMEQRWELVGYLRTLGRANGSESDPAPTVPSIDIGWDTLRGARSKTDAWLTYSGGLDGWRHSPLRQITPANVAHLRLIWAEQLSTNGDDSFEETPIVTNGTIFISAPPSNAMALDAASGRILWRYEHPLPDNLPVCCGRVNRGMAILGGTLFLGTVDAKLVALDARTGAVKWGTTVADPTSGYTITSAPLIAKDAVIIGAAGGEFGARGFLTAYDAKSGKELWRFQTIPGPGEFGHETWKNDAWKTGGGPTWITGSFDPELDLIYWGVGNPSPNYDADVRPGDNLFTNSVIALNVETGKLAWYFQFTPHDAHDWDSNQTPILAELPMGGKMRKVVCWANRNGFYYVLDRKTGEFLVGVPFVKVDWASGLDEQGRPIPTKSFKVTTSGMLARPWVGGGTNWPPPSFDPASGTFFVQATEGSSIYTSAPAGPALHGENGLYVGSGTSTAETAVNVIKALDAATGTVKWEHRSPRQQPEPDQTYSGLLSTDSGLVFGAYAGDVFAMDSTTGKEVWQAGLGGKTQAAPITFTLNGKQVVAVTAGKTFYLFGL